jgi:hypothetical protein
MTPETLLPGREHVYEYLRQRCANLQTLVVPQVYANFPTNIGKALLSLRSYYGPVDLASCCVSDLVEELRLTPAAPNLLSSADSTVPGLRDLFKVIPVSPSRLRKLELRVPHVNPDLLEHMIDSFPLLESLSFLNISSPPPTSKAVRVLSL